MQYITSSTLDGLPSFFTQASDIKEYVVPQLIKTYKKCYK